MQSVERWINSLPTDAPVYAQTSLTDIIPISNPKSFPDELSISESQQQPPPGEPSRSESSAHSLLSSIGSAFHIPSAVVAVAFSLRLTFLIDQMHLNDHKLQHDCYQDCTTIPDYFDWILTGCE